MLEFEFDPAKSQANALKHGIDFIAAQALWDDENRLEIAVITEEPRFLVVGQIDGKAWSAVIAYRGETVRIISVRRARKSEEKMYARQ